MSTLIDENTRVGANDFDRHVGSTVQARRHSLGVSAAELAKASGLPRPSIDAIERGGASTRAERYDIALAFEWLSNYGFSRRRTMPPAPALASRSKK